MIRRRLDWAVRQGHPGYVWPDLPFHVWRACLYEIERVTAKVLTGSAAPRLELPEGASARALGIAAFTSGMGPLLGYWIEQEQLQSSGELNRLLELHLRHGRLRAQRMARELASFVALMAHEQVPVAVIKGAHTALTFFPDAGTRPAADVDVVVPPAAWPRVSAALMAAGYRSTVRHPGADKCDWSSPGSADLLHSLELNHVDNPLTVEVHASLDRVFDGVRTVRLGELKDCTEPWRGDAVRALHRHENLAYLALHASQELHQLQLLRVVELILVMRRDFGARADWADLRILLQRLDALRFVYPAFELAERLVPNTVPADFMAALAAAAHPRLLRVVESLRPATAQRIDRLTLEDRLMWADGWWETAGRLAYLVWPTRARHSRRALPLVYRERLYRLLRGRFRLR